MNNYAVVALKHDDIKLIVPKTWLRKMPPQEPGEKTYYFCYYNKDRNAAPNFTNLKNIYTKTLKFDSVEAVVVVHICTPSLLIILYKINFGLIHTELRSNSDIFR